MANFSDAYALTMRIEGGYANNPADPGGETYKGIARNYNPHWAGWATIDAVKNTHPASLNRALGADEALSEHVMAFYKTNYWDVNQTGLINDQQLANQVFDTAVNCGTGTAAGFLQQAAGVVADKRIGTATLAAANGADVQVVYSKFIEHRRAYYLSLISKNPKLAEFKTSWLSRLWPYKNA